MAEFQGKKVAREEGLKWASSSRFKSKSVAAILEVLKKLISIFNDKLINYSCTCLQDTK